MVSSLRQCNECQRTEDTHRLTRCPICYKLSCQEHSYQMGGRVFCSTHCAQYFFFASPDEEDEDE